MFAKEKYNWNPISSREKFIYWSRFLKTVISNYTDYEKFFYLWFNKEIKFAKNALYQIKDQEAPLSLKIKTKVKKEFKLINKQEYVKRVSMQIVKKNRLEEERTSTIKLLNKHRKNYDCIVPGSGGKDSAYAAHILKYKYNMNPLTVTWAPHLYTNIGWDNFMNWLHIGGFDNILFTPNGRVHRALTKLAFQNLLHPFQPFIIGQKIIGPLIALKFNIPLIFYGENQAEYGNAIKENDKPEMDESFFSTSNINNIILSGEPLGKIIKDHKFKLNDFKPYIPPEINEIKQAKIEQRYLGYYLPWDPQECFYYASKHTGFRPNSERTEGTYSKYSSIDDKIDPYHYFCTYIKFGIGRAT